MKLIAEFEGNENMTSIGFVKALIDTKWFRTFDLCEITCYLNTYCAARNVEPKSGLSNVAKGGEG
jgi:hypothetical protein